jgi:hypothetical protein
MEGPRLAKGLQQATSAVFVNPVIAHVKQTCGLMRLCGGPLSARRGTYLKGMETILVDQG